jgi:RNA polymerase sigma factor (sigma-70 family)
MVGLFGAGDYGDGFYEECVKQFETCFRTIICSKEDKDDLVAQGIIIIWKRVETQPLTANERELFKHLVSKVAHHLKVDYFRKASTDAKRRADEKSLDDLDDYYAYDENDTIALHVEHPSSSYRPVEDRFDHDEQHHRLEAAIKSLRPVYQAIISLYLEGYSADEIAGLLSHTKPIKAKTVSNYLSVIKEKLHPLLVEYMMQQKP